MRASSFNDNDLDLRKSLAKIQQRSPQIAGREGRAEANSKPARFTSACSLCDGRKRIQLL